MRCPTVRLSSKGDGTVGPREILFRNKGWRPVKILLLKRRCWGCLILQKQRRAPLGPVRAYGRWLSCCIFLSRAPLYSSMSRKTKGNTLDIGEKEDVVGMKRGMFTSGPLEIRTRTRRSFLLNVCRAHVLRSSSISLANLRTPFSMSNSTCPFTSSSRMVSPFTGSHATLRIIML